MKETHVFSARPHERLPAREGKPCPDSEHKSRRVCGAGPGEAHRYDFWVQSEATVAVREMEHVKGGSD